MPIRIFIDPGHNIGNINAGASGNGLNRAEITFNVSFYLAQYLQRDPRFEVRMSRTYLNQVIGTDTTTSLQTRVAMANEWPADYFISIHCNSNINPTINGSEVYIYTFDSIAYYLAQDVLDRIVTLVHTKDNLVRENPSLYVLRATNMPSILVELAYLSNYLDSQKLRYDQQLFAQAIYEGMLRFFRFYGE